MCTCRLRRRNRELLRKHLSRMRARTSGPHLRFHCSLHPPRRSPTGPQRPCQWPRLHSPSCLQAPPRTGQPLLMIGPLLPQAQPQPLGPQNGEALPLRTGARLWNWMTFKLHEDVFHLFKIKTGKIQSFIFFGQIIINLMIARKVFILDTCILYYCTNIDLKF